MKDVSSCTGKTYHLGEVIINREGVIVNYGNMMRPSYPGTAECMDEWLEK